MKSENLYAALAEELQEAAQQVIASQPMPADLAPGSLGFVPWLKLLFDAEERTRMMVDEAMLDYIEHGSWPRLDAYTTHFLGLRLMCAFDLANLLASAHAAAPHTLADKSRESLLRWLSIEGWNAQYDSWLKVHALSLFFSLPFYGVD